MDKGDTCSISHCAHLLLQCTLIYSNQIMLESCEGERRRRPVGVTIEIFTVQTMRRYQQCQCHDTQYQIKFNILFLSMCFLS